MTLDILLFSLKLITEPKIIKIIPIIVLKAMDSFRTINAKIGAKAGLIKKTIEAVEAEVFSIAKM